MATSTPVPEPVELVPVAPQERLALIDVLRGFCLFGVLWSNLNDWFISANPVTPLDHALSWTQDRLLEGRFYSMLGFLFGIGFAIQLMRAEKRGQDVLRLFCRRMTVLLVFGILHGTLIWDGDILTEYALLGFVLVLFRRLSRPKLLIAAAALLLLVPYFNMHVVMWLGWRWTPTWQTARWVYAHGTWGQIMATRVREYVHSLESEPLFGGAPQFLALFVLGLLAVRVDLLNRLTRSPKWMLWGLAGALFLWGAPQYARTNIMHWWSIGQETKFWEIRFWPEKYAVLQLLDLLSTWGSSCAYALILALAVSVPYLARAFQPLAALGRMTLTTYLTQSVVATAVFYHWGLDWMTTANFSGVFVFTVIFFSLQMTFSVWWLRHYRFGPLEWLWRSLAYGRRLPSRISPSRTPSLASAS